MTKKLEFDDVRKIFADKNCILLSEEYINAQIPLDFQCHCGRKSKILLQNFKKRGRCYKCGKESGGQKQKFNYEDVKEYFAQYGCELLSPTYINCTQKLDYLCSCGKIATTSFVRFRQKSRKCCTACAKKQAADELKHSYEKIKKDLADRGYELLGPYVNSRTPLNIKCNEGHITNSMTYDNIMHDEKCPRCMGKGKLDLAYAQKCFEERGCILLAEEYKNNQTPMPYVCKCGRANDISLANLKQGKYCRSCALDKNSGKSHKWWNPDLTEEDRIRIRSSPEYRQWRKDVLKRDHHTCQCCGYAGELYHEAHHLNGYHHFEELRFDLSNGIDLCFWCHNIFHYFYNRKNNTEEQWKSFLANKDKHMVMIEKLKQATPAPSKFHRRNKKYSNEEQLTLRFPTYTE